MQARARERRSKLRAGYTEEQIEQLAAAELPSPPDTESEDEEEGEAFYGVGEDGKMGECHYCKDGGVLLCCDGCEKAFHFECLVPPMREADLPEGDWFCEYCLASRSGGAVPSAEEASQGVPGGGAAASVAAAAASSCASATAAPAAAPAAKRQKVDSNAEMSANAKTDAAPAAAPAANAKTAAAKASAPEADKEGDTQGGAPKKVVAAKTAQTFYMQALRKAMRSAHPGLDCKEVDRKLQEQWRALAADERTQYNALAEEDKLRCANPTRPASIAPLPQPPFHSHPSIAPATAPLPQLPSTAQLPQPPLQ